MAAGDTQITIVGNLVGDPELRYTPTGQAVATFRVASTPRFRDNTTGEWKDGDSLFLSCNVWRQAAENVAESLQRGMRVIVSGRLRQRSYETREGEKRTVYEIEVDEVGPSLRNASAKVVKSNRSGGNFAGQGGGGGGYSGGGSRPAEDAWTADPSDGFGGDTPDEPPCQPHNRNQSPSPSRGGASIQEHHDGESTHPQAQTESLPVLPGEDRLRRLQGHAAAAEVHLRPRQDPGQAGNRQLHPAPARRRHGDQERAGDGDAALHEHAPVGKESCR